MTTIARNKSVDKKTAVKLINSYAETYKILEDENKRLKEIINDLNENLQINKKLIISFSNTLNPEQQSTKIIQDLSTQLENMSKKNIELTKSISEIHNQVSLCNIPITSIFTLKSFLMII